MHEYSLVASLLAQVEQAARMRGATRVHCIDVDIGEQSGVEIPLFREAFDTFRSGALCATTELRTRQISAIWTCPECRASVPRPGPLRCPECAVPATLEKGGELVLQRIEMEVPHV